ncbi:MAG: hypothetical protein RLZZ502_971 [Pseudomonadota bacterium]|jgi:23S rRNA (cytosine1962-C5)-methyltransferase
MAVAELAVLRLKAERDKSLKAGHPWVFSGAIDSIKGTAQAGDTVLVRNDSGQALGLAAYSPHSQIAARLWTSDSTQDINADFLRQRLKAAIARRGPLSPEQGMRLVHAESDYLPGLIVDRYADTVVTQILSAGAEKWRDSIHDILLGELQPKVLVERSDVDVRPLEGLESRIATHHGKAEPAEINEHGVRYFVDVMQGHKTGFYLDQSANRLLLQQLARGKRVLNACCYTGGFSHAAALGGASHITSVDSSGQALDNARRIAEHNGHADKHTWVEADVFEFLRGERDRAKQYDLIVLDPPKFAPTAKHVDKAARAYKDINLLGMKLLAAGGDLLSFSCSAGVSDDLFYKILAGSARDARADMQVLARLTAHHDHPATLHFPEGHYLKGLHLRKW